MALTLVILAVLATGLYAEIAGPRQITNIEIVQLEPIRTHENAIRRFIDIEVGQTYPSAEALEDVVDETLRDLKNTR